MLIDQDSLSDEILRFKASHGFRRAIDQLDFMAVCLVGYTEPVVKPGSNRIVYPVSIRTSRDPENATKREAGALAVHDLATLEYVWVESEAHAKRLKDALDVALLGEDASMVRLLRSWRDLQEWKTAWPILLADATQNIRSRGEKMVHFDEKGRLRRVREFMRQEVIAGRW